MAFRLAQKHRCRLSDKFSIAITSIESTNFSTQTFVKAEMGYSRDTLVTLAIPVLFMCLPNALLD